MHIANPIYDVVFKYLLEDNDIAKLLISTIIGEEIVELDFLPQERTIALERRSLTVYRLDFAATIKKPDQTYKQVIIEIQKAKFAADIMRFRRYLGDQYHNKEHISTTTRNKKATKHAMPIVSIYFLGYRLEHTRAPVIEVARRYYDKTTGEEIFAREEFIESLTHDSYVIQIPCLRPEHATEIEQLLWIFDQHNAMSENVHILQITEEEYPEKYAALTRRLQRAIAEPDMKDIMDAEDEILEELQDLEREIEQKEELLKEKDQTLEENARALEDKDRTLEDKDRALEENARILEDKDRALEDKDTLIEELRKSLENMS